MASDDSGTREEFDDAVNMTCAELQPWLDTDESKSVGDTGGQGKSTGHEMGRRIVELQQTKAGDLDDDDVAAMRKVVGYVHRHLQQPPTKQDIETSKWRYSLMDWGHEPLKKQVGPPPRAHCPIRTRPSLPLPVDARGKPWHGAYVSSSGNLVLNLFAQHRTSTRGSSDGHRRRKSQEVRSRRDRRWSS